jgi:hypothetical protein
MIPGTARHRTAMRTCASTLSCNFAMAASALRRRSSRIASLLPTNPKGHSEHRKGRSNLFRVISLAGS